MVLVVLVARWTAVEIVLLVEAPIRAASIVMVEEVVTFVVPVSNENRRGCCES